MGRRAQSPVLHGQWFWRRLRHSATAPGTYSIEAWHEKLGTQTQMVTIGPKETKELSFTFKL